MSCKLDLETPHSGKTHLGMLAADFAAIHHLHARYCHAVDFGDYDGIAGCFAPDGSYGVASEPDHPANRSGADMRKSPNATASKGHGRHLVVGSLISGDGRTGRSLTPYLMSRDFGPSSGSRPVTSAAVSGIGIFADDLVKIDGRWAYQKRRSILNRGPEIVARLHQPLEIDPVDAGDTQSQLTPLDLEAIRHVLLRACHTLDLQDHDGFVDCFNTDGAFDEFVGRDQKISVRGTRGLRDYASEVGRLAYQGYIRHNPITSVIEGDGAHAYVSSYGLVTVCWERSQGRQPQTASVLTTGLFRDELTKASGRWRLSRRSFRKDTMRDVIALIGKPVHATPFAE